MLVYLYNKTPKSLRDRIGKSKMLKWFRDLILKKDGIYKESTVNINKQYLDYSVSFKFVASIKEASNAYTKGIENKMLRNSIKLLRQTAKKLDDIVIFDVGANFGYLSLVWAKTACQTGKVISFEPSSSVFRTLKKSIEINNLNDIVKLENLAVGNENKDINLYINNATSNVNKTNESQESETIQMVRLDDYVTQHRLIRCDLIKIDVDGIELDILKGSVNLLKDLKPILIVETNNDMQIIDFFNENNYVVLNEKLEVYKPTEKLPLNVYCVPNL